MIADPLEGRETSPEDRARSRALTDRANALRAEQKWDEALELCFEAARADPSSVAAAHNLTVMLTKMGRLEEGEAVARHALKMAPNMMTAHALAHNLLAQGRFAEAWPHYDVRGDMPELNTGYPRDFPFARWRGESLEGKHIAVFPEQGLGDQIQFARFLPRLLEQAARVTLLTLPPLERLFRHNFPGAEVVVASGSVEFPDPDYWITLLDLPAIFGVDLQSIPTAPYLTAPGSWPALGEGFKIGLKAKGNPNYINDATRSLPADLGDRLRTGLPGRVISLEPTESGARDLADTAAIIDQLDMIVSVDTSVAHLAGAMGKPCLLLLPGFGPDWRWMVERTDSPWYPNHALYRGDIRQEWRPAVERLITDAHALLSQLQVRCVANQALALRMQGKFADALATSAEAYRADPGDPVAVQVHSTLLYANGRLEEAEAIIRRALERGPGRPEFRHALALTLLAQGRYHEAWPFFEARTEVDWFDKTFPRDLPFPRWRGEDLSGKRIAVFPEQGLGDQLQFARFLPELLRRGAQVTLLARPPLVRLFAHNFPDVEVLPTAGRVEFPDPDYWTTLVDIAAVLDVAADAIPAAPYLAWPEIRETLGKGPRIGIKLHGNPDHHNDAWRSLPAALADKLRAALPGTIVDLDPQVTGSRDFADTAAIIAGLDLVISVDTSVAHLAGAMGKECRLLLPGFDPDWRWMTGRTDSPWYPAHRLYRGGLDGNWDHAVGQLLHDVGAATPRALAERLMREAQHLRDTGEPLKALETATAAVAADPTCIDAVYMQAIFLGHVGRLKEGEAILRRVMQAVPHLPNPRDALATNLLAQGRYVEGWPLYEARTEREGLTDGFPRNVPFPRWKGENLNGKRIVLFPEQGLGDQIQYVRFVPALVRQGAQVTLLTPAPLVRLFRHNFPDVQILEASGAVEFPDPDYWATIVDLPVRLAITSDNMGASSYLRPVDQAAGKAKRRFSVGLMTRGNAAFVNDRYRSLPPDMAALLQRELPGRVVDLAPEATGAKDFADTASIIAGLDMVVSVDTAVAHLAGAMGKTCVLMLSGFASDWRWMRERRDTPWYPDHILYRADIQAGWEPVVRRVVHDVKYFARPAGLDLREAAQLRAQQRYPEALAALRRAVAAEPDNAGALHNYARLLADLGRTREAEAIQRRALAVAPKEDIYRYGLGLNLLSQGKYEEGWDLYESRTRIEALRAGFPRGVHFPRWQGEDISGKRLAVFPEQGFGDQIQFARFVPQLRERCAELVLLAPPALRQLFEAAFPGVPVIAAAGEAYFPRSDMWTTLVELGRLLGVRLENLPDPQFLDLPRTRPAGDGKLRIGYMWRGNPGYIHDRHRSLPQKDAEWLGAALPGEVIDLAPEATGAQNFMETAQLMADLDLVVSVDTSVGHLAGAIGKPCHLLVSGFGTDWRWLHGREDSPWYPRHHLYRSTPGGDWSDATARLLATVRTAAAELGWSGATAPQG